MNFSVCVLASERYLHCLPGFAYLFNLYWSEGTPVTIYLNAEMPVSSPILGQLPRNFMVYQTNAKTHNTWSKATLAALSVMEPISPLAVILLEDYFLDRPANVRQIAELYRYMLENEGVVKIDLTDDRMKYQHTTWEPVAGYPMVRSTDNAQFQTSLQAAIWRKDFLERCIDPDENPWQFEKEGTRRLKQARQAGDISGVILGCETPPLHYINAVGGEGNHPHIWAKKRFPPGIWNILRAGNMVWDE